MRLKRNYSSAIKRKWNWFLSRFKPLTVHTEALIIDEVWEKVKKEVEKGKIVKWYVMTPANSDYFKSEFNVTLSKEDLSRKLKERYKWMLEKGQNLELHIHLSLIIDNMSYEQQERLFDEAINWMKKEIGIVPREFVPGWWSYNENTFKICKRHSLRMVKEIDYDYIHDYDFVL